MEIREKLTKDLKSSMISKDKVRLETVRSINGAITNFEKANPAKDVDFSKVLKQLESQRKQSIEGFTEGGNAENAAKEQQELSIIQEYINEFLPKQMSDDETKTAVEALAAELNLGAKDVGRMMGEIKKKFGTSIDMQKANAIVKALK